MVIGYRARLHIKRYFKVRMNHQTLTMKKIIQGLQELMPLVEGEQGRILSPEEVKALKAKAQQLSGIAMEARK